MGYLICYNCNIYYEVTEEQAKELKRCGKCGSSLTYFERLEDCYSHRSSRKRKNNEISPSKKRKEHYSNVIGLGILIALLGISLQFSVFLPGTMVITLGLIIAIVGGIGWGLS